MITACGIMHRMMLPAGTPAGNFVRCIIPHVWRNYSPKHVELIEIINKPLLLYLVGCLYYCIRVARSRKHQT